MLILTVFEGKRVVVGDARNPLCVIELVDIRGTKVRLGVSAATNIPINPENVANEIAGLPPPVPRPTKTPRRFRECRGQT